MECLSKLLNKCGHHNCRHKYKNHLALESHQGMEGKQASQVGHLEGAIMSVSNSKLSRKVKALVHNMDDHNMVKVVSLMEVMEVQGVAITIWTL